MSPSNPSAKTYGAAQIDVLEFPDSVRKRPGMYIGDTDDGSGLHHMVYEVVDNAIDEALAGFCRHINVEIQEDGAVSVEDDGRGIPTDIHPELGVPGAEVVMTKLHAGGKFNQNVYKVSGGLHGLGVSVVNALSSELKLDIWRDQKHYTMIFRDGLRHKPLTAQCASKKRGTKVTFTPSAQIFSFTTIRYDTLLHRFRELAFLNPGLTMTLRDAKLGKEACLGDSGGVAAFLNFIDEGKERLHPLPIPMQKPQQPDVQDPTSEGAIELDIALAWNTGFQESCLCFTNTIPQRDG